MKLYTNFDNFINEAKVMKQKDTAKIAQKLAAALSKADGKEFTISKNSLDAGGFDLDMDGDEYAGGTYFIGDAGEIVNAATSNDVYGNIDDSEAELVKNIKKGKFSKYRATESVVTEAKSKFKIGDRVSILSKSSKKPFDSGEVTGIQRDGTILINGLETISHEVAIDAELVVKESVDIELNEALASSKLRGLIDIKKGGKELIKGIYGLAKIALDKVTDDMIISNSNPVEVYKKAKTFGNVIVFWISRNEKENEYAPSSRYVEMIPGNCLLAVSNGKNEMFQNDSIWNRNDDMKGKQKNTRRLKNMGKYPGSKDTVGVNKSHNQYSGTGLGNIKRIAEVSDECYIINLDALRDSLSTNDKTSARAEARSGATALTNPKKIKEDNLTRYNDILAKRADNPDKIDKKVKEIIEDAHQFLMAGLAKKELGNYNELTIGKDPKGREIRPRDLNNYISNILSDYQGYVSAYVNMKTEEEQYGKASSYYMRDAKRKALELKQRIAKWDNKNIVW